MKEKIKIPKEYIRKDGTVSNDAVIDYIKKIQLTPKEALEILVENTQVNFTHPRTEWKLFRFTLYLWERLKEYDNREIGQKKDTVYKVVRSKEYKDMHKAYSFNRAYNEFIEANNLLKLISDARQRHFFKSQWFYFKNTKEHIPQELIDKIR